MSLTPELIKIRDEIREYAREFGLDPFEVIFELVDYDQINTLAAQGGFPVRYPHWRFGMFYDQLEKSYSWGLSKIYEMVINNNPSYAYLMNSNPIVDQKTVIAHVYGHSDFFKNNYWFSKTNRKMLDSMANHAVKIRTYMDEYGQDTVEQFIDYCLSIENLIDPYLPFQPTSKSEEETAENQAAAQSSQPGRLPVQRQYMDSFINPKQFIEEQKKKLVEQKQKSRKIPSEPDKDILGVLLKYAPLEQWEWDVLNIVRDEAYYFAPQMQTKIMNEGWASYWHSKIMTEKALRDSEIIDFADHHAGVLATSPGRVNPYKLGIELFRDIEDRWNRGKFGKEYDDCDDMVQKQAWDKKLGLGRKKIFEVRKVCNDVTFMDEYLTPEFVDQHQLYTYEFNRRTNQYEIVDRDFKRVKEKLLVLYTNGGQPFIYVTDINFENRGELLLMHKYQGVDLDLKWAKETMISLEKIWKRPVNILTEVEGHKKIFTQRGGEFTEKNA